MYSEGRPYHLIAGEGFLEPLAAIAEDQLVELPDPLIANNLDIGEKSRLKEPICDQRSRRLEDASA